MNKFSFTIMTLIVMMMPFVAFSQNDEVNNVNETPQFNDYFYLSGDLGMPVTGREDSMARMQAARRLAILPIRSACGRLGS